MESTTVQHLNLQPPIWRESREDGYLLVNSYQGDVHELRH